MDVDAILKLIGQVGLFVVAAVGLWYAVFVPRRNRDGTDRSALAVPGWQLDAERAEKERMRLAYEARLADLHRDQDARQAEWRRLRDEERARAIEADQRLSASTDVLRELVGVVHDARVEVARLAGVSASAAGGERDAGPA